MTFADHVPLRERLWFHTGGVAEYYTLTKSTKELAEALTAAAKQNYPYRVIGNGCNTLMSDSGFPGLIIQNESSGAVFLHDRSQVLVESGMALSQLIIQAVSHGYSGLEPFVGIPGTVGGAVASNISAHGYSLSEYVKGATVFDPKADPAMQAVDRTWFEFGPHTSVLARHVAQPPVIISVLLQLSKLTQSACAYRMKQYQTARRVWPTQQNTLYVFDSVLYATAAQPTVGRPIFPLTPPCYVTLKQVRQWRSGDVGVTESHPGFLMNGKMGTSRDAFSVIKLVRDACGEASSHPQPLVHCLGLWDAEEVSKSLTVL